MIPFAALSVLTLVDGGPTTGFDQSRALAALITYGMIILSFMGGVQWGLEMSRIGGDDGNGFAASVVPALVAFAASFASTPVAILVLAAGFLILLVYDRARIRVGVGPAWYGALRLQLSTAVVICLVAAAFASRSGGM